MVQGTCWREGQEGRTEHSPREPLGCSKFHFPLGRDRVASTLQVQSSSMYSHFCECNLPYSKGCFKLKQCSFFYYQKDTNNVLHSLCLLSCETVDASDLGDHKIYLSSVNFSHFWELPLSHATYFAC